MVPRAEIIALEDSTKIEKVKDLFIETGLSKIPIYKHNENHVFVICFLIRWVLSENNRQTFERKNEANVDERGSFGRRDWPVPKSFIYLAEICDGIQKI